MSLPGAPALLDASPAPTDPWAAPAPGEVLLVVENDAGRARLFAMAERALRPGEVLVQVKDLWSTRRSFHTRPLDPRARLVARERPLVLRGGITSLVSYYAVPAEGLAAKETHFEEGRASHSYDVMLRVACRPGGEKARVAA